MTLRYRNGDWDIEGFANNVVQSAKAVRDGVADPRHASVGGLEREELLAKMLLAVLPVAEQADAWRNGQYHQAGLVKAIDEMRAAIVREDD